MSGSYGSVGQVKEIHVDLAIDGEDSAVIFSLFEEGVEISPVELTVAEATKLSCLFRDAARYLAGHQRETRTGPLVHREIADGIHNSPASTAELYAAIRRRRNERS